jgi:hypothetical protein
MKPGGDAGLFAVRGRFEAETPSLSETALKFHQ